MLLGAAMVRVGMMPARDSASQTRSRATGERARRRPERRHVRVDGERAQAEGLAHRAGSGRRSASVVMNEPPPVSSVGPVRLMWVPTPSKGKRSSATR